MIDHQDEAAFLLSSPKLEKRVSGGAQFSYHISEDISTAFKVS
jgi:hypothetical protein